MTWASLKKQTRPRTINYRDDETDWQAKVFKKPTSQSITDKASKKRFFQRKRKRIQKQVA